MYKIDSKYLASAIDNSCDAIEMSKKEFHNKSGITRQRKYFLHSHFVWCIIKAQKEDCMDWMQFDHHKKLLQPVFESSQSLRVKGGL